MAEQMTLHATGREATGGNAAQRVRNEGNVPAVVYGHGLDTSHLVLERVPFEKVYEKAGESTLIDLSIDEAAPVKVVVNNIQRDPVSDMIIHVDLYQVNMKEKMTAEVMLTFSGVSAAVKTLGGILIKNRDHVEVECLPANLPHDIEVNIDALETFDDVIRLKDLNLPEGVELTGDNEASIATVEEPRSAEELAALDEAVVEDVDAVEVEGATEDGEEAAEGAEAPAEKPEGDDAKE